MSVNDLSERGADVTLDPQQVWERQLTEGHLSYQECTICAHRFFYPRSLCPSCGSMDLRWLLSRGLGTLYATTNVHSRNEAPTNVSLIDMAEGFRVMGRVTNASPEAIGSTVRLKIVEEADVTALTFDIEGRDQ